MDEKDTISSYEAFKKMRRDRKESRRLKQESLAKWQEDKVAQWSFLGNEDRDRNYANKKSIHILKPEGVGRFGYGIKPDIRKLKRR
ncbi:MAG: hypothetical protein IJ809_02235 [Clostridia bacterium]|nr:hypothetical protein [Clostridia bacterium]